jgi:hypothetical protein
MPAPAAPAAAGGVAQAIAEIIKALGEIESTTGKMPRPPGR